MNFMRKVYVTCFFGVENLTQRRLETLRLCFKQETGTTEFIISGVTFQKPKKLYQDSASLGHF
jgi:hypothetical protein